jgi:hypothetical protein
MTRARLIEDFKAATAELNTARQSLANEQFRARHGISHTLMHAVLVEHTVYHRWQRIGATLAAYS